MAQRYGKYKDSGVQWLGEIPEHWGCTVLKRICEMKSGNNLTSLDILDDGAFPVYGANGIRGYYNQFNKEGKYILIGRQGALAGNVHLVKGKFWATDHAVVTTITSDKVFSDYLALSLESMNLNQYAFDTAAQPGLAVSKIISFSTPLPPLSEQHAIASYLDSKCGKIDDWLAKKQKEVEHLQELKQRIIADAVTRGLNPEVKMKEPNIPWLPEVPEHWVLMRGKYLFRTISEYSTTGQEELLTVSDRTGVTPRSMKNVSMFMAESLVGYKKCIIGDICSNIMWMWHGAVGVTKYEGVISPSYAVYRQLDNKFNDEYLDKLLRLPQLVKYYAVLSKGLTESRLRLYPDDFLNIMFFVPPLEEQRQIVTYITEKTSKIDTLITNINKEIENIKEYKQRLISDVVTGQIKVC